MLNQLARKVLQIKFVGLSLIGVSCVTGIGRYRNATLLHQNCTACCDNMWLAHVIVLNELSVRG